MAITGQGRQAAFSDDAMQRVMNAEDKIIQSLLDGLDDPDPKIVAAARRDLIAIGFTKREDEAVGVVDFLLKKARAGAFGQHAAAFDRSEDDALAEKKALINEILAADTPAEDFEPGDFHEDDEDDADLGKTPKGGRKPNNIIAAPPKPPEQTRKEVYSRLPLAAVGARPPGMTRSEESFVDRPKQQPASVRVDPPGDMSKKDKATHG